METILRIASVPRLEDGRGETISEVMRAWGAALRVARVASFNKKQANRNQAYRVDIYSKHLSTTSSRARAWVQSIICLLYTSPSPRDRTRSRMPSSA